MRPASWDEGGVPIGSVLVKEGKIIGRGHSGGSSRAIHGPPRSIVCARPAASKLKQRYFTPRSCLVFFGGGRSFGMVVVGDRVFRRVEFMQAHGVEIVDLDDRDCVDLLGRFMRNPIWNEDIGR